MRRYIELAPDPDIPFQSGKIIRSLVQVSDTIQVGDPLFIVNAQGKEVEVSASKAGKVNELIVDKDDIIHKLSSLLVLEILVEDQQRSSIQPTQEKAKPKKKTTSKPSKKAKRVNTTIKHAKGDADKQASLNFEQTSVHSGNELTNTQENNTTMSEIKVPDLGGADAVEVIDILVKVGDTVNTDDPLMTVESDKASMDIPAASAGTITDILVAVGDNVSEGDVVFKTDGESTANDTPTETPTPPSSAAEKVSETTATQASATSNEITIIIPDLGGANDVEVIDVLVNTGDTIEAEQAVITVESDKASMDVPSSHAGVITSVSAKVGDIVNEGDAILLITSSDAAPAPTPVAKTEAPAASPAPKVKPAPEPVAKPAPSVSNTQSGPSHASPSVRRLARELGVDLSQITGTARKNRISKDDVKGYVKTALSGGLAQNAAASGGAGIPEIPAQDFSKFGEIELQPLNKIKRVTAQHLHRCWLNIPHVTHNDEANIQSLEDFRKLLNAEYAKKGNGIKLSPLAFVVKVVVNALQNYPQFNSSLENGGENLVVKKYYNIGIAVETPNGLVVPVIRDADKLSVAEIALAMGDLAKKARDGKLKPSDMQGATFSISSLGGIGGTSFTPIVNAPEVAILGVSRTKIQPEWDGSEFIPAPVLPLSLSYDHRVIDGAEAARFTRHIAAALEDIRRLTV